tara:strand:+ start:1671 stop:2156 length:486 start_codon:yes stop_codon:yes gene_type:complete
MKKYIVVDTWNGEGYSYNNGVDTKQFQYKKSAFKHAYKRVLSNTDGDADLVCRYSDEEMNHSLWEAVKRDADGDGFYWETYDDNSGSYQVFEIKDAYAIMILCNVNEVSLLTKKEYEERISELNEEYGEDLEEYYEEDDNGDKFYCAIDDYDFQFRLIKNL